MPKAHFTSTKSIFHIWLAMIARQIFHLPAPKKPIPKQAPLVPRYPATVTLALRYSARPIFHVPKAHFTFAKQTFHMPKAYFTYQHLRNTPPNRHIIVPLYSPQYCSSALVPAWPGRLPGSKASTGRSAPQTAAVRSPDDRPEMPCCPYRCT